MNIGFDLDKVFINYPPLIPASLIDFLYKEKSNGILRYRIPSKIEQFIRLATHLPLLRRPILANISFIRTEHKNGNKFYLISSRFSFLKRKTNNIIKKYEFEKIFDNMFFNFENDQPHIFKNKIVRKLKLDRYVDDDLALLQFLAQGNKKITFYWLNSKMNKKMRRNLFAITQLSDILT